jgi:phosphoglucomutase
MPAVVLRLRTANDNSGVVLYVSGNGIKVYGSDGAQLSTDASELASRYIEEVGDPLQIDIASVDSCAPSEPYTLMPL